MTAPAASETWSSRIGVILAVTGSAVGLGNFLRFPGQVVKYGGGAFMIPYFVALLVIGLPIAWVEWSMGRYGGARGYHSAPGVFRAVVGKPWGAYLGVLGPVVPVMIYMYYVIIEAWCLGYALRYLRGGPDVGLDASGFGAFFERFTGGVAHGSLFGEDLEPLLLIGACYVMNFALVYRGVSRGIEWFCRWAMPALVVCALVVLGRVLTLGTPNPALPEQNVENGLGAMWNLSNAGRPVFEVLANPEVWLAAAGQIFFSLSVGFGIIVTYASYMKHDDDVALSSLTAVAGNEFCEVSLGGLVTIPAAFVFLGPAVIANPPGTFGMGFVALPNVFSSMPGGAFFGFLFFFLLFVAALTSSISMLQPAIALFEEGIGVGRKVASAILGFVTLVGTAFVSYFSGGFLALDTLDFWIGNFAIFVLATVQVILFGWVLGIERGLAELDRGATIRLPRIIGFVIKYVSPTYLLVIFALWLTKNLPERVAAIREVPDGQPPVALMSIVFIGVVVLFFGVLIARANRRWDAIEAGRSA